MRTYQVKDVARIAKVTVRTLHHYDAIGLLKPSGRSSAGYRLYSDDDLLRLQQVLVCRELGMPLEEIRRMLDSPGFDRRNTLLEHRGRLAERARDTERMIRAVDAALQAIDARGGHGMDPDKLFDGFNPADHEEEAERRWGGTTAYKEAARRTARYTNEDWTMIRKEMNDLLARFAERFTHGVAANEESVVDLAEEHRLHFDRWYYPCSRAMHASLGEMYLQDPRFAAVFEKQAEGLTAFVVEAIRANSVRKG